MTGRLVELAGPAGAGKTTLVDLLREQQPATRLGLPVDRAAVLLGLATAAPVLARARLASGGRWWTVAEQRSIGYLVAWQRPAGRRTAVSTLLDHGPTFRLAALRADGPPMSQTPAFRHWWLETAVAWGLLLDTVVWLDAPDDVLIERIRERSRGHRVKGASADEARLFLARHRAAYDATLDLLNRTGARVIRVDTSTAPASVLAAGLAERLDSTAAGHRR